MNTFYTVVANAFVKDKLFHTTQVLSTDEPTAIQEWLNRNGNTCTWEQVKKDWKVVKVKIEFL